MIDKFNDWPASDIDRADIRKLIADLKPAAQIMQVNVARNIFKFGVANDMVLSDPTQGIEIDHETIPHDPWPQALIDTALAGNVALPVALLYYTGQRIGDVCKMRWSDIDEGVITVVQQKTGKEL